jgi:parallel beta-helix repeat protein
VGIFIWSSSNNNIITNNNITVNNIWGMDIQGSTNNRIFHNNFINNVGQASDNTNQGNSWNDTYPSGGNYWSNYCPFANDFFDGPITPQTTGFPDRICDIQYDLDADSVDYYPLKGRYGINNPPVADAGGPYVEFEGTMITFDASGSSDPDGHTLIYRWDFNNDGIWDTGYSINPTATFTWGDDYEGQVAVEVSDGGLTDSISTTVTVKNADPTIVPFGSITIDEGEQFDLSATANDAGSDDLTFTWEFEYGPTITTIYYNDGTAPDPSESPFGNFPFSASDSVTHTYYDNYEYTLTLTVSDDNGGSAVYSTSIIVNNVAPTIIPFNPIEVYENSQFELTAYAEDIGSDDLTFIWEFEYGTIITHNHYNDGTGPDPFPSPDGNHPFSATDDVQHTFGDDGAFYVHLTVQDDDGDIAFYESMIIVHNIAPTINWITAPVCYEGDKVNISAHVTDPGSDDLEFTWEIAFRPTVKNMYYNDGSYPDPPSSPDINPMSITDKVSTIYWDNGRFDIKLTVRDDDSGSATAEYTLVVFNVRPIAFIDEVVQPNPDHILPNEELEFHGRFWDPGVLDTHLIWWDFGDGHNATANLTPIHSYDEPGIYNVTLMVTDDEGWFGIANVTIVVISQEEAIEDLIESIEELNLPRGIENSLLSILEAAINALERGNEIAAENQLEAFQNMVEALSKGNGKKIKPEDAEKLLAASQFIIDSLNNNGG